MNSSAIITAAGYGQRMGKRKKKQFLKIGNVPIIVHSLQKFQNNSLIDEIILVVPDDEISFCKNEIKGSYNFSKLNKIVPGGEKRQDSVLNGLQCVSKEMDLVVVHDGVRPFITSNILNVSIKKAGEKGAAVLAIPVKDTLIKASGKKITSEGINRDSFWRIQTPQVFKKEILLCAFEKAQKDNFYGTDESSLVSRLGIPVYIVTGSELNIKITTPEDLILAESILITQSKMEIKKPKEDRGPQPKKASALEI